MRTVVLGDRRYRLEFEDDIPMTELDNADLEASIEEAGQVTVPVVCWKEKHQEKEDTVVDGAHRILAAIKLGLKKVPILLKSYLTHAAAKKDASDLNFDRRKDFSPEIIRMRRQSRLERTADARAEGKTIPEIAKAENVSTTTVQKDVKKIEEQAAEAKEESSPSVNGDAPKPVPLCPRCKRLGSRTKDCKACADLETRKPRAARTPKSRATKPGKPTFDDRAVVKLIGDLARQFIARAKAHDCEVPKNLTKAHEQMEAAWKQWQVKKERS